MPRATRVLSACRTAATAPCVDTLILPYAQRQAQKGFLFGVKGTCVELDFAEPVRLRTDDALVLDDGGLVEVVAEPEPLIEARAADLAGAGAARLASRRPARAGAGAGAPAAAQARPGDRGAAGKPRRQGGRHRGAVRAGGRRLCRAGGSTITITTTMITIIITITTITIMAMTTTTAMTITTTTTMTITTATRTTTSTAEAAAWSGSRTRSF